MKRSAGIARHMGEGWTRASSSEYIDIHRELLPYQRVLEFFEEVESNFDVMKYCSGANEGGRWVFQIYSVEFVNEIADLMNGFQTVLEVMSGDGKLTEFLSPRLGAEIIATDARVGSYGIAYPKWVEDLDAIESLSKHKPDAMIMVWEPFYSSVGREIVETGTPLMWIGDRRHSAVHSGLFDLDYIRANSRYALGRRDSFVARQFETDIFLFNWVYQ